jgi:hypothetical protein
VGGERKVREYKSKKISKEVRTFSINSFVDVVQVWENDKEISSNVVNKNTKSFGPKYTLNENCWMVYIDRNVLNDIITNSKSFNEFEDKLIKSDRKNLAEHLIENDVKEEDFVFWYSFGHVLFDHNARPISTPLTYDYCEGASSHEKGDEYFKIIEILKTHPYVKSLETFTIPYYNSNYSGHEGIKFCIVLIPQDKYEELYDFYKQEEHFCVRMREQLRWNSSPKFDLFGVSDLMTAHFEKKYN